MNFPKGLRKYPRFALALFFIVGLMSCNDASQTPAVGSASQPQGYTRVNEANENDPLNAHIFELDNGLRAVSYTHLTLPTIYSV